jgi:hypothetical protein
LEYCAAGPHLMAAIAIQYPNLLDSTQWDLGASSSRRPNQEHVTEITDAIAFSSMSKSASFLKPYAVTF